MSVVYFMYISEKILNNEKNPIFSGDAYQFGHVFSNKTLCTPQC